MGDGVWWAVSPYLSYKHGGLSAPPPSCCGSTRGRVIPAAHFSPWREVSRRSPAISLCQRWYWGSAASVEQFNSLILQKMSFSARLAPWRWFIQLAYPVLWNTFLSVTAVPSLLFVYQCIEAWVFKRPPKVKCLCLLENLSCFSKPHWKGGNFHC